MRQVRAAPSTPRGVRAACARSAQPFRPTPSPPPAPRYAPTSGEFLVTASYDGTIRAWSGRDFSPIVTLRGHENKVAAVDVAAGPVAGLLRAAHAAAEAAADAADAAGAPLDAAMRDADADDGGAVIVAPSTDEALLVSASFDRTVKLWR